MAKIGRYIPFLLSIFLSLGIIAGYSTSFVSIKILIGIQLLILPVLLFLHFKKYKILFQVFVYLFIFLTGWTVISLQNPVNQASHFFHYAEKSKTAVIQITEKLKPSAYQEKYLANVIQVDSEKTRGLILINIDKDSTNHDVQSGELYLCESNFTGLSKPMNPYGFDYSGYMKKQGVYYQYNTRFENLKTLPYRKNNLTIWALQARNHLQQKLSQYPFGKEELGIINALLLGDKKYISKDLQGKYAAAGAVHILAISGLHVGILFMLLSFLLSPLKKLKNGQMISGIIVIVLLWFFALIAGMSASVVRAVTMFSFIGISLFFQSHKSPVVHALFSSYFILLLIYPLFLFDVGFQLSYLAVLGIITLQPVFEQLLPSLKNWILKKLWQLITTSVAATLATLPLSLYYFHQFPGLFILTNLVIIPALGIILGIGLLVIFLASINLLPNFIVLIYNELLQWMNQFISWVGTQEQFLLTHISFSLAMTVSVYLTGILGFRWILDKKIRKFQSFLVSILILQSLSIYERWEENHRQELIVYHKTHETIIGNRIGKNLDVTESSKDSIYPFLKGYALHENIDKISIKPQLYNVLNFKNQTIFIVDSMGVYQPVSFKTDYILLTQSPKINLERLLEIHHPKAIIADGSNYKYITQKWEKTCKQFNTPFYNTSQNGAFVLH